MKISLHSDLHTEFHREMPVVPTDVDVIVLAGDIGVRLDNNDYLAKFCNDYSHAQVIMVAGNHDYYSRHYDYTLSELKKLHDLIPNFSFLENDYVDVQSVRFIGCTLWSDFTCKGPAYTAIGRIEAARNIGDFFQIKYGIHDQLITPVDVSELHRGSVEYIRSQLLVSDKRNVVITHFPPLIECKHPTIPPSILDTYFNNDLSDMYEELQMFTCSPTLHLYGHNHHSDDFVLYGTRFISNQRGYPRECTGYDVNHIIEI